MSECHYWWRTGEVQWCDMKGDGCQCGGWDDYCDMKHTGRRSLDLEDEKSYDEVAASLNQTKRSRRRRAA